ncbi:ATP-binding protein [Citricoccus zhacaiensis]
MKDTNDTTVRTPDVPVGFQPGIAVEDPIASHWLGRATGSLRREIAWLWHEHGETPEALTAPADPLVTTLDLQRWDTERSAFFATDATARWLSDRIGRPATNPGTVARGSFGWLAEEMRLADVDRFALALALGGVLDSARGPVIAACLNDPGADQPTPGLVQRLWDRPTEAIGLVDPSHPLSALGVFDPPPATWNSSLEVPAAVARQLLFPGNATPSALEPVVPGPDTLEEDAADDFVVARLRTRAADRPSLIPVVGPPGSPRAQAAARIASRIGMPLMQARGVTPATLGPLAVVAWLRGTALYLPFGVLTAQDRPPGLDRLPVVVFVGVDEGDAVGQLPGHLIVSRVHLNRLSYEDRLTRWRRELPEVWADGKGRVVLTECARRFRTEGTAIERVAAAVRTMGHVPARRELFDACRADLDLGDLAQAVVPRFDLDELMLPERQAGQVRALVTATESLTVVHHEWGTARAWNECGLSVLFSGPPGTGKTMAAEAIARAVDMPIYRIDLSQVVDKYIGETEKNLRRLFDAADAADVILFFDEADALFGKRSEVKDAHDRYANLEISYLLERMERFTGMAVLASNRKKDLDEAFMRRLRFVVQFPLPGPKERRRIWGLVVPDGVDASGLDLDLLAEHVPLAGGHIRSAVFNACLQSVRRGKPPRLEMAAVVQAVKDEFDKLGRAVSLDRFGDYQRQEGS